MLDVSRQSVSKWENNSATPDLDKIVKLSEIFGILIFNTYYYASTHVTMIISLIISWAMNLTLLFLGVITVLCFKSKPLEMNRKNRNMFLIGVVIIVLIKVFLKIYPTTAFFQMMYDRNYGFIPHDFYTVTDWVQIVIGLLLIFNFVRYFFNKSAKNK